MSTVARITSTWKLQRLLFAVAFLAYSPFFFWDGAIRYPSGDERYHQWKQFNDAGQIDQWQALAQQKGWKVKEWEEALDDEHHRNKPAPADFYGRGKYSEQFIWGSCLFVFGLVWLGYWLSQKNRTVRTDDEAVYSPAGTRIPFEAITGLGKKKWDSKGLATVLYKIDGRQGRFVLDDYKFERDPTHEILKEIEEKLLNRTSTSGTA